MVVSRAKCAFSRQKGGEGLLQLVVSLALYIEGHDGKSTAEVWSSSFHPAECTEGTEDGRLKRAGIGGLKAKRRACLTLGLGPLRWKVFPMQQSEPKITDRRWEQNSLNPHACLKSDDQ
jgi:hypothetical protein